MERMIAYIFGSLESNDKAIESIVKVLKSQHRFNKGVNLFAIATTIYIFNAEKQRKKLEKEIKELKEELKGE